MDNALNRDFYHDLPGMVCVELEDVWVKKFGDREWFPKAWEEYREHIQKSTMDDMRMPGYVFKKYLSEEDLKPTTPLPEIKKV